MRVYEQEAEVVDPRQHYAEQEQYSDNYDPSSQSEAFSKTNDLKVIQEYNREENMPAKQRRTFWALTSKSIKLGFWKDTDHYDVWLRQNTIKVNYLMSRPKHKYTFEDRLDLQQMELLLFADFKRGVGMERYKINERTLQATSVTQSIQGAGNSGGKRGGMFAGLKNFFG